MCVKLFLKYLNPDPYPPIGTYACRVTITLRIRGGKRVNVKNTIFFYKL